MPSRIVHLDGHAWRVYPSGFVTRFDRDEFGLLFVREAHGHREVRLTRYSPQGIVARDRSLAELSDAELATLFAHSQSSVHAPETGYRA
ncbi:MAG: hypothetical protein HY275_06665 [Gemmatimonadetes bacterium]|nr:hypothetical protein [Gemmatimonadota bacterium]